MVDKVFLTNANKSKTKLSTHLGQFLEKFRNFHPFSALLRKLMDVWADFEKFQEHCEFWKRFGQSKTPSMFHHKSTKITETFQYWPDIAGIP